MTWLRDRCGLTTVEYGLLLVVIALAGFAAWQMFGGAGANIFVENAANAVQ